MVYTACSYTTTLAHIEDLRVMLQPIQVASQLLGDITLAPGGQADHDNNQLGTHISRSNAAIRGDLGLSQTRNVERAGTMLACRRTEMR